MANDANFSTKQLITWGWRSGIQDEYWDQEKDEGLGKFYRVNEDLADEILQHMQVVVDPPPVNQEKEIKIERKTEKG